ncbi:MAG: suppressor of fused domain protein [Oscillospiraceae bacterium]|nr:suppressor of fused domain protein [Oscillospiraceae bacterium]
MKIEQKFPCLYTKEQEEKLKDHIEKYLGKSVAVFREEHIPDIKVDIHLIAPCERYAGYTLVTSGAGAFRMDIPEDYEHPINSKRAEYIIRLPENWEFPEDFNKTTEEIEPDENLYWPLRWLRILARMPIIHKVWLGWGHTVPCGSPFAENTDLCCVLVEMPYVFGIGMFKVDINAEEPVHFYQLIPLYREEMEYKIQNGTHELMEMFDDDFSDIVDINRKNYCADE